MKKFLSLMLCLALLLGLATTAYATGNTTTVSLEVPDETYTLKIPATVTIDATSKTGSVTVEVADVNLIWSTGLKVVMTAQNTVSGETGSYLVNEESGNKIHYNFSKDVDGNIYGANNTSYKALDTILNTSNSITLTVDGAYPGAGTYTDVLTFTVNAYKLTN